MLMPIKLFAGAIVLVNLMLVVDGKRRRPPCNATSWNDDEPRSAAPLIIPADGGNDAGERKCSDCCPRIYRPVCGTDGKTYQNEWCLENDICWSGGKIQKARDGEC